jgi:hypothetical protein
MSDRELDEEIIRIRQLHPGDYAAASALRETLRMSGAVTVRPAEQPGRLVYERAAELPEWRANDYGSDAFNEYIERVSKAEQERFREIDERRAQEWENSPFAAERRMMAALIDERTSDLREQIEQLREQVAELQQSSAVA